MLLAWFLIGYLACSSAFTIRNPPKQRVSKFYRLARNESVTLESVNYPKDAPGNLRQTWRLECQDKTDRIHLKCEDIRLFQETPCGPYVFKLKDTAGIQDICRTDFNFEYKSTGSVLQATLHTGKWDRGFVSCKAIAIEGDGTTLINEMWPYPSSEEDEEEEEGNDVGSREQDEEEPPGEKGPQHGNEDTTGENDKGTGNPESPSSSDSNLSETSSESSSEEHLEIPEGTENSGKPGGIGISKDPLLCVLFICI